MFRLNAGKWSTRVLELENVQTSKSDHFDIFLVGFLTAGNEIEIGSVDIQIRRASRIPFAFEGRISHEDSHRTVSSWSNQTNTLEIQCYVQPLVN